MKITCVDAFQIFDSRGNPTLEAEIVTECGIRGRGLVPSGASTGQFEALELRDGDPRRFRGRSVDRAIECIRGEIAQVVIGRDVLDQRGLDEALIALDGTSGKSRLGANAILGVSLAAVDAAARVLGLPIFRYLGDGTTLPLPEVQILGGGAHAHWRTDLQDWMIMATGATNFDETLEITFEVFHAAGDVMKRRGILHGCSDEGGYWPEFRSNEEAFGIFAEAVALAGYTLGVEASLSLDIAASDLYDPESRSYRLNLDKRTLSSEEFINQLVNWCRDYKVSSIEDPAADTDWIGWEHFHRECGSLLQIVGDDLFTTNAARIREGIHRSVANSVLIKPNQIGTVSETLDAIRLAQDIGWAPIVSARSGETEDAFISHLAVATNAGQLKVGSFCRGERMSKWNECLRIQRILEGGTNFKGRSALAPLCCVSPPFR